MAFPKQWCCTPDRLARFLAGMPALEQLDPFHSIRASQFWKSHSQHLDRLFQRFDAAYAEPFANWVRETLGGPLETESVFYPFSGPDFLFPHLLSPDAKNYVLCGLETGDTLFGQVDEGSLPELLQTAAARISHFLEHSYFLTEDLRKHDLAGCLSGILPLLLIFLSRAGRRVHRVQPLAAPKGVAGSVPGIYIEFQNGRTIGKVFYFQQDLRDMHFSHNSPLFKFVDGCENCVVFSKSASYLLHEPYFSKIRNLIFARGSILVQDPSSVPYRLLEEAGWVVDLFGCYRGTLPIFNKYEQADLVKAYQSSSTSTPLGFGIGYLTDPGSASLMAARRAL
jgi:hypothetical protein